MFLSESLPDIAKFKFDRRVDHALGELFVVRLGISFDPTRKGKIFTYHVAESASIFYEEIYGFRKNLITWFVFLALIMMGTVAVTLSGALSPVRRAAQEIKAVEQGKQNRMLEHYPNEISVLTENLNQLIASNQNQLERQSNALSDLAHSLKTPLATAIATVENETMDLIHKQNVLEQMDTINSVIEYQLKRAQTKGKVHLSQPIAVFSIVEKVVKSLKKVHSDKNLRVCTEIDHDLSVKCDKGDLYELFGNLLDNAFKWARSTVGIKAVLQESKLTITVQDDGPGIDGVLAENAFERGVKSDTVRGGSGIGLAVVADIVSAYSGHIETKNLNPCGLEITLSLFQ
ncbi:MAG: ATP-binding protein [Gammaproteobacteria bacterium]|nr:ATP-binding protein [Gammaproteobacteria bacterium]